MLQAQPTQAKALKKNNVSESAVNAQQGVNLHYAARADVQAFIENMVQQHGFSATELNAIFARARYLPVAAQLMMPPATPRAKNWAAYRARFIEPLRINAGLAFWREHAGALARAQEQFGVPAEIIAAIIGVETIYGRNVGNFRVMDALTTLAFDYPDTPTREKRSTYFKGEVENFLLLVRENNPDIFSNPTSLAPIFSSVFSFLGSYAGAIGLPQFMPSSIRKFALDFDGDGKVNLSTSAVDAIGSVANFLVQHGWQRSLNNTPVSLNVSVEATFSEVRRDVLLSPGLTAALTTADLMAQGVRLNPQEQAALPAGALLGFVDLPNGLEGMPKYRVGTANFFAITQYNRSFFYASAVTDFAQVLKQARAANTSTPSQ